MSQSERKNCGLELEISGSALIGSVFYTRFWCRYLCPAGAFLSLFNNLPIPKLRLPAKSFGRCEFGLTYKDKLDCIYCDKCRFEEARGQGAQRQKARTLTPTITRNKGTTSTEGYRKSSLTDSANKETVANTKGPAIRSMVSWYVTDSTKTAGYRKVNGLLEDPNSTDPGRDDDNQVRT